MSTGKREREDVHHKEVRQRGRKLSLVYCVASRKIIQSVFLCP